MRRFKFALLVFFVLPSTAKALEPSEILLIVNGNSPVSKSLAEFYAHARHVPAENMIALDVPGQEEISQDNYRKLVAAPVRAFLAKNDPEHHIKCLLTFTGLPIRISNRTSSPEQNNELDKIRAEQKIVDPQMVARVQDIEALVRRLDPAYKPPTDLKVLQALTLRVDRAIERLLQRLNAEPKADVRRAALEQLCLNMDVLTGPSGRVQRVMFKDLPLPTTAPATEPASQPGMPNEPSKARRGLLLQTQERITKTSAAVQELSGHQDNPAARVQLRDLARAELGLLSYARVLDSQEELLNPAETGAALDNELALVLWGDQYPLYRWIENPLYFRNEKRMASLPAVMMVMRLDGPQDSTARDIIVSSLRAEQTGLGGKVVIDSQGLLPKNPDGSVQAYGEYDETLRNLAKLLKEKTSLSIVFDEKKEVLRAGSVKDVGLYVGWYAVRNYIPSCSFRPGAVGFHIASLEMISLKAGGERGWVAGLLNDGIAATLGAVNEPYLHSFPKADEFFPLLLTGKLTLAEVYWRTNPLVSWQISMIGDPLYVPFRENPALKEQDLPLDLQAALQPVAHVHADPASRASKQPSTTAP